MMKGDDMETCDFCQRDAFCVDQLCGSCYFDYYGEPEAREHMRTSMSLRSVTVDPNPWA